MSHCHFFVYGTLKRGQCREGCWPENPISIQAAVTRGSLYDTGPYPALFRGDDWVLGELWTFPQSSFETIANVLDAIEEYDPNGSDNLYVRAIVPCWTMDGSEVLASLYLYARTSDRPIFKKLPASVEANGKQVSCWPA